MSDSANMLDETVLRPRALDSSASSGWGDPALWLDPNAPVPSVGTTLNGRFVLEEPIGHGGMGKVFKARDLRKVEAQDRNPFVAIKVLSDEFRRHPHSLQALQRESRKTQRLAHPNIVSVYDFDRDGANVYMVMELLEGEPLDQVIGRAKHGVGAKEALRIAYGICRAMAYAHEQGIVHADFKPANAFLTRENGIKVLDFGIARAVHQGEQPSGDKTLFDVGTLGALTPAYAGCEVVEGQEADARDDVYAIACVTYELITGRHPFSRLSATQARDAALVLAIPRGLSGRQWRTLQRALALRRDQRPRSARELLEGLRPSRRTPAVYVGFGVAAVAAIAVTAMLVAGQIDKYHERDLTRALASGEASRIEPLLPTLRGVEPARRASVLLDEPARAGLAKYFAAKVNAAADEGAGRHDYRSAEAMLSQLEELLPDSQAVEDLRERLVKREAPAEPTPAAGAEAPPPAAEAAPAAAEAPPLVAAAESAPAAAEAPATQPPAAALLRSAAQKASQQRATSITASRKKLESLLHSSRVDDAWLANIDRELQKFADRVPASDPYIAQVKAQAAAMCLTQATALRAQQRLVEARHMLDAAAQYAPDVAGLSEEEQQLGAAERAARVPVLKQKLLEEAQANDLNQALIGLGELRTALPGDDPFLTHEGPAAIAAACVRLASQLAQAGRFTAALDVIGKARSIAPSEPLSPVRDRYTRYQAIDQYLTSRERIDARDVHNELAKLARQEPTEALAAAQGLLRNLVVRINSTHDPRLADRLLQTAKDIFGADSVARVPAGSK